MVFQMPSEVRSAHPYFMYEEVHEQPEAWRVAIERGEAAVPDWAPLLRGKRRLYLTGCGTSFHAAVVAEYWLRTLGVAPDARAVEAFELTTGSYSYRPPTAVIAFSQGGSKGMTVAAVEKAKAAGATVLTVTGNPDSPLAKTADAVLATGYDRDLSWAHTISYTTCLAAFLRLAIGLQEGEDGADLLGQLNRLPAAAAASLRDEGPLRGLAKRQVSRRRVFILGSGANYGTALEAGLKMRETNYAHADGLNAEYFLHGPISSLEADSLVIGIAAPGSTRNRTLDGLRAARTIGAATLGLGEIGDQDLPRVCNELIELPPLREELTPLLYVVPLQLVAYWQTVELGFNPDLIRRDQAPYFEARRGYQL
jgi:glutamine---fructose-6-phosphate transaminase (isomerizing)